MEQEQYYYQVINFLYLAQNRTYGEFLRKARRLNRLTQEELASALNVSQQHISLLENNSTSLSIDNFVKICELLNIIPRYLSKNIDQL